MNARAKAWLSVFAALAAGLLASYLSYQLYSLVPPMTRTAHPILLSLADMASIGLFMGVAAGLVSDSFPAGATVSIIGLLAGQSKFPQFSGSFAETSAGLVCGVLLFLLALLGLRMMARPSADEKASA